MKHLHITITNFVKKVVRVLLVYLTREIDTKLLRSIAQVPLFPWLFNFDLTLIVVSRVK